MTLTSTKKRTRPRGFAKWNPDPESLELVEQVLAVVEEYRAYLPLTLRQVFYRLVGSKGYDKTDLAYKRLGGVVNRARRAKLIPFDVMRDDGIKIETPYALHGLEHALDQIVGMAYAYRLDRQIGQKRRIMVMCETAGMVPQLSSVCDQFSIAVQSTGGFDSTTAKACRWRDAGDAPWRSRPVWRACLQVHRGGCAGVPHRAWRDCGVSSPCRDAGADHVDAPADGASQRRRRPQLRGRW